MTPDVVVDIGNSRIKWGRCLRTVQDGGMVSLPLNDLNAWDDQLEEKWGNTWEPGQRIKWAIGGVNPKQIELFTKWLKTKNATTIVFNQPSRLPIRFNVDDPDAVGIDRVFGAIAAKAMAPVETPVITVDVGTAVTVNLVDADGVFQGGAIFPGPRLMAQSLHQYTAKLPLVELTEARRQDDLGPRKNTADAIRLGLASALDAGVFSTAALFASENSAVPAWLFITGGGHQLLDSLIQPGISRIQLVPTLNLEGIRIAAESLP